MNSKAGRKIVEQKSHKTNPQFIHATLFFFSVTNGSGSLYTRGPLGRAFDG